MLRKILSVLLVTVGVGVIAFTAEGQDTKAAIKEIKEHRRQKEKTFRDKSASPLLPEDRKKFRGLNYFEIDLDYRVTARFVETPGMPLFAMKTTTERLPEYRKFGEVHFTIQGQPLSLEVYQSPEIMQRPGYEDYLFIPFTDETNGHETYEVGRYLELRIPSSGEVIIDFNMSYSPYCSYNPNYSCPIPPAVNHIPLRVEAGEKKFKDDH